jgi:hypothetical protein
MRKECISHVDVGFISTAGVASFNSDRDSVAAVGAVVAGLFVGGDRTPAVSGARGHGGSLGR